MTTPPSGKTEYKDKASQIIHSHIGTCFGLLCDPCAIETIYDIASKISGAISSGKKVLIFGNGGSAADAQHLAAEFVNRFQMERRPLPAIALTTDTSIITSIANDFGFEDIFLKQIQAIGTKGDVAVGISTSGNSENVVKAMSWASMNGLVTVGFKGAGSSKIEELCDHCLDAHTYITARAQEIHIIVGHVICELVECALF